ncbi:hypothetical protein BU26DRAFT_515704 [Trematosphaeria pertusa]|uniref:Uncharacterized protein n=1 Tax=Trematosphaeria pertusa TaxID=390896 RepID=A0A6A6IS20_9PLEO|nr:uncharacterized protein BU26DRAFT_515704 [Trematosphaeria pertusa]KAF2253335.1 hypothetical protein BU26DRAFT_515704 [Trematosphaeria pertusa]
MTRQTHMAFIWLCGCRGFEPHQDYALFFGFAVVLLHVGWLFWWLGARGGSVHRPVSDLARGGLSRTSNCYF